MKITLKRRQFEKDGISTCRIEANDESGQIIAAWVQISKKIQRGNSSYDLHRINKGDNFEVEDSYAFEGDHEKILDLVQRELPKSFIEADWKLRKLNDDDHYATINFLKGLAGSCAWYGNTPKNIIKKVEKAQKTLSFSL
jgi:hypothetical protein